MQLHNLQEHFILLFTLNITLKAYSWLMVDQEHLVWTVSYMFEGLKHWLLDSFLVLPLLHHLHHAQHYCLLLMLNYQLYLCLHCHLCPLKRMEVDLMTSGQPWFILFHLADSCTGYARLTSVGWRCPHGYLTISVCDVFTLPDLIFLTLTTTSLILPITLIISH